MRDFIINSLAPNGKDQWQIYIDFTERLSEDHTFISCSGSALILAGGERKYWFNYWFGHTPDWISITELVVRTSRKCIAELSQLDTIGDDIVNYIKEFISRGN